MSKPQRPQKPITEIKRLLGLSSAKEVAHFFELNKDRVNNINSGRGSKDLHNAYANLCLALKALSADKRRSIFQKPPKRQLTLSQKYQRCDKIKKDLPLLAEKAQQTLEEAFDLLNEYIGLQIEYEELRDL